MLRSFLSLVLGLSVSSAIFAQARPPIPSVVLDHMNDLDRRCVAAGGRAGEGRFVVAQDFTGDGRLDYLLSEGDYDCVGRPGLFRKGAVARVDLFVVDARNAARRVYSDQLIAYRVLAGQPAPRLDPIGRRVMPVQVDHVQAGRPAVDADVRVGRVRPPFKDTLHVTCRIVLPGGPARRLLTARREWEHVPASVG